MSHTTLSDGARISVRVWENLKDEIGSKIKQKKKIFVKEIKNI